MEKFVKTQHYFQSFFLGLSALILPTFFQNQDVPKIEIDKRTTNQRVQLDYARSLREIKEEVSRFGYKAK